MEHPNKPSMRQTQLQRLWISCERSFDGSGPRVWYARAVFFLRALLGWKQVRHFLNPEGSLSRHMARRPETLGALSWPYISLGWSAPERLSRIRNHFLTIDSALPALDFDLDEGRVLADFSDLLPGLRLVLDQPKWFLREGQLCINIFIDETRLFSLAFSLARQSELVAYVGALQGRNIEGVLETYKRITNALLGMRPRDFVIEAFLAFCRAGGITHVYAVSDVSRHHRSPYFGKAVSRFTLDYDEVWRERGGRIHCANFYELPVEGTKRDMSEVPSKKRSMYRKRYALMDRMEADLKNRLTNGFAS